MRGPDRARRGAAADGRTGLPRDASGGGGDRLGAPRRRPRCACGAGEQSWLREPPRCGRRGAGRGNRAGARARRPAAAGPPRAAVVAAGQGAGVRTGPRPADCAGRRGGCARPPDVRSADARDGNRKLRLRHLGAGQLGQAVRAGSRADRAHPTGAGSAGRVRRQDPGAVRGDRARRFRAGGRDARAGSGDRGADTAADAEMQHGLRRRLAGVHARRIGDQRAPGRNRCWCSNSDRRQVNPTP